MSLFFNTLSRLVIGFLPRSKHLLISWLQSLSTVTLEPKKITFPPVTPGTEGWLSRALPPHDALPPSLSDELGDRPSHIPHQFLSLLEYFHLQVTMCCKNRQTDTRRCPWSDNINLSPTDPSAPQLAVILLSSQTSQNRISVHSAHCLTSCASFTCGQCSFSPPCCLELLSAVWA